MTQNGGPRKGSVALRSWIGIAYVRPLNEALNECEVIFCMYDPVLDGNDPKDEAKTTRLLPHVAGGLLYHALTLRRRLISITIGSRASA